MSWLVYEIELSQEDSLFYCFDGCRGRSKVIYRNNDSPLGSNWLCPKCIDIEIALSAREGNWNDFCHRKEKEE